MVDAATITSVRFAASAAATVSSGSPRDGLNGPRTAFGAPPSD